MLGTELVPWRTGSGTGSSAAGGVGPAGVDLGSVDVALVPEAAAADPGGGCSLPLRALMARPVLMLLEEVFLFTVVQVWGCGSGGQVWRGVDRRKGAGAQPVLLLFDEVSGPERGPPGVEMWMVGK
eukprot:272956-Chlamydomonas_euryale.AAC.2